MGHATGQAALVIDGIEANVVVTIAAEEAGAVVRVAGLGWPCEREVASGDAAVAAFLGEVLAAATAVTACDPVRSKSGASR